MKQYDKVIEDATAALAGNPYDTDARRSLKLAQEACHRALEIMPRPGRL